MISRGILVNEQDIRDLRVRDVMETSWPTLEPEQTFEDAEIKAPGFLDILGGVIPLGNWDEYRQETLKSAGVTVGEVMTEDVVTISPDASLAEAATIMAEERKKLLPVAEEGQLRGVVTRMDILTLHVLNPRR